jgi:hypothetical protein
MQKNQDTILILTRCAIKIKECLGEKTRMHVIPVPPQAGGTPLLLDTSKLASGIPPPRSRNDGKSVCKTFGL